MILADNLPAEVVAMRLLEKLRMEHDSVRLHYDREYGMGSRNGWCVSVDGIVLVEFAPDVFRALALAVEQLYRKAPQEDV